MKPSFLRLVGAALVLAAGLAGCGGGETVTPKAQPAEPVAAKAAAPFTGHGIWWNPAEPGSGFFFEAQGLTGVITFYMYETNGRPAWYMAAGSFKAVGEKYQFDGALQRYAGGQPGKSAIPRPATSAPAGTVSVTFDGFKAQGVVAGRAFSAQKYFQSGTAASIHQPETGIYWNAGESGRGYAIEVNGNLALVTAFHYALDGQPIWHLTAVPFASPSTGSGTGDFIAYAGGQSLAGAYKPPASSAAEGTLTIAFGGACQGQLTFPDGLPIAIKRFAFGAVDGSECRSAGTPAQGGQVADAFVGTWAGCYVTNDFKSVQETHAFEKASDTTLAYKFITTAYATRDCSGAAGTVTQESTKLEFLPNGSTIIDGIVMRRVQGGDAGGFKLLMGLQSDTVLRVGDRTAPQQDDAGYPLKLFPILYQRQ